MSEESKAFLDKHFGGICTCGNPECDGVDQQKLDKALPLVKAIYATSDGAAGCCLHIVLDDENCSDADVNFCYGFASARGHKRCIDLCYLLLRMNEHERTVLGAMNR